MPELKTNNYYFNMPAGYGAPQNSQYTGSIPTYMQPKERTVRDEFVYQHKKTDFLKDFITVSKT